jgi:uncharacterized membrane protein
VGSAFPNWAVKTLILLAFGLGYVFAIPLFEAPDEIAHFIRAYGVSEGNLILRDSPKEVVEFVGHVISGRDSQAFMSNVIENTLLNATDRVPNLAVNVSMYSPVPYIPHALVIKALQGVKDWNRRLTLSAYLCRSASLLVFVVLLGMTFRLAGEWGWPFFWVGSSPMALSQASIISVDYAVFSAGCLVMAASIRSRDFKMALIYIVPSALLLTMTKLPYSAFLLFSVGCIFMRKEWTWKSKALAFVLIGVFPVMAAMGWNAIMFSGGVYDAFQHAMLKYGGVNVDASRQIDLVIRNIPNFITVFTGSLAQNAGRLCHQFVGVFGLLDTPVPMWIALVWGGGCALSVIISRRPEDLTFRTSCFLGLWLIVTGAAVALSVGLAAYIVWMPVEAGWINLQGRYFHLVGVAFLLGIVLLRPFTLHASRRGTLESGLLLTAVFVNSAALVTLVGKYWS